MNADYVWKLSKFGRLTSTKLRYDDDFSDRLNYQFTGLLLFVSLELSVYVSMLANPYNVGHLKNSQERGKNMLRITAGYPQPNVLMSQPNFMPGGYIDTNGQRVFQPYSIFPTFPKPKVGELPGDGRLISYYQWAPILLAVQSFLFYLPCLVWRLFASQSGFQVKRIMQFASEAALAAPAEADVPCQPQTQQNPVDQMNQSRKRTSAIAMNIMGFSSPSSVPSFSATKSVRTLARYLDMCFMRQRELRRSILLGSNRKPEKNDHMFSSQAAEAQCDFNLQETAAGFFKRDRTNTNRVRTSSSRMTRSELVEEISEDGQYSTSQQSTKTSKTKCLHTFNCSCKPCLKRKSTSSHYSYNKRQQKLPKQTDLLHNLDGRPIPNSYPTQKSLVDFSRTGNDMLIDEFLSASSNCCSCWSVEYNFYGIRVLYDLAKGRQWEESGHFPRVTFCDFEAKKLAQSHYYTLQCVLPINMFLEKIYIFLWLWFFVVGIVTFCSIVVWIKRMGTQKLRLTWIQQQLITIRQYNKDAKSFAQFVNNHLGPDGVFLLRLIAQNYGDLVAGDTVGELWVAYWQRRSKNLSERRRIESNSRIPNSVITPLNRFDQPVSTAACSKNSSSRNQPYGTYQMSTALTREQMENKTSKQTKKDRSRRTAVASGVPTAMLATEMVHPADRYGVPLIAATRKPPSVPSRSSSRYSQRSRSRERSQSPPPIPSRSPGCENYSFSDKQSLGDFEHQSENSSVVYPVSSTGPEEGENVGHQNEDVAGTHQVASVQDSFEYEDSQGNIYTENLNDQFTEDVQNDDNIV
ncbi:unnamed protein product [Heterobilharzia americana]|nr:unnamed protein product [Heterobilharzia americana]